MSSEYLAVLVVLILILTYYYWPQIKTWPIISQIPGLSTTSSMSVNEREAWASIERARSWEHDPSPAEARANAASGRLENGQKYTGSSSKYFPEANMHPTLTAAQINTAERSDYESALVFGTGDFNPDDSANIPGQIADSGMRDDYNHQEYIEDDGVGAIEKKSHMLWATERKPYSGVAKSPDDVLEVSDYLPWQGIIRPSPVYQDPDRMLFVTEVDADNLKSYRRVAFQG